MKTEQYLIYDIHTWRVILSERVVIDTVVAKIEYFKVEYLRECGATPGQLFDEKN
jgi:hypothetical protein